MTTEKHDQTHVIPYKTLFPLGQVVATPGALDAATPEHLPLSSCLRRRVLSAYPIDPTKPANGYGSNRLWIITERDHLLTTL